MCVAMKNMFNYVIESIRSSTGYWAGIKGNDYPDIEIQRLKRQKGRRRA